MSHKNMLLTKCLSTHSTSKGILSTMYPLMRYHITLLSKCLITYTTGKGLLTTMYLLMQYQITLLCLVT